MSHFVLLVSSGSAHTRLTSKWHVHVFDWLHASSMIRACHKHVGGVAVSDSLLVYYVSEC